MKLTKTILGTAFAIPSVVVPLTTMTSCSQSWGNKTPFVIGSDNPASKNNPYQKFNDGSYIDFDGQPINYLQSNYAVQPAKGASLAYSAPMKFVDHGEEEPGTWELGNCGWYTSYDSAFPRTAFGKVEDPEGLKDATVTNARNASLAPNIDFVTSIGTGINNYLSAGLQYLISLIRNDDGKKTEDNLDIALGKGAEDSFRTNNFFHGSKGSGTTDEQNTEFFEFICSLANLVGSEVVEALFRTSSVNYYFEQFPLPSYKYETKEGKWSRTGIDEKFIQLIEGTDGKIGKEGKYWSSESDVLPHKIDDETTVYYRSYTYRNVPIRVHVSNLTKTFMNPTNNKDGKAIDSFLPNDYYSTDEQINKSIGNSWEQTLHAFTSRTTYEPEYKTFTLQTQDSNRVLTLPEQKDERITNTVHGTDFIILMNYAVNVYQRNQEGDPDRLPERDSATVSSISNIFPAYFIDLYGNDMFKKIKDEDDAKYVFNTSKIDEKNSELLTLLNRTSAQGRIVDLENLNKESKNLLTFLAYIFGNAAKDVDTANFIFAKDKIPS